MSLEELRMQLEALEANRTRAGYVAIRDALMKVQSEAAFHLLFPLAVTYSDISDIAAALLVEREPTCPLACEDALRMLGAWQVSDSLTPFYLKQMFGKARLLEALASLSGQMDRPGHEPMRTVAYWVRLPSVETLYGYMFDRDRESRLPANRAPAPPPLTPL
jgi:hypothetical protein